MQTLKILTRGILARGSTALGILALGIAMLPFAMKPCRADQTVVVVLDDSGSMAERMRMSKTRVRRMDAAKKALLEVLDNLPADTRVGVLALNTKVDGSSWVVPLDESNPANWRANIDRIRADGGTPLGEFMRLAADELLLSRKGQLYGNFRMLVVTDGEANDSRLVEKFLPQILARGIVLDVIGVDMTAEHSLAQRSHSYRSADDDQSLKEAISEVFAETSADDQNAAEDFELIAGLPDGFAEQALLALNKVNNTPLDENAQTLGLDLNASSGTSRPDTATTVLDTVLGGLICCFGTFLGVGMLIMILVGSRKRPRRRIG